MATRVVTKIGDVFKVEINESQVKYFQLIAFDLLQLNSDVIRGFESIYLKTDSPSIEQIVNDKTAFYAHCVTKFGIKMNLWEKVGNSNQVGNLENIIFRSSDDYGDERFRDETISENWHIWKLGDENFTKIKKLEGENRNSFIGMVINPLGIIELIKGNKYPPLYPDFI